MGTEGEGSTDLLVAAGEPSFGDAAAEGLEAARGSITAATVDPGADPVDRAVATDPDGVVVGGGIESLTAVVKRLSSSGLPVVLLADAGGEGPVAAAVEAGAADVFPRTAAECQCALVADRLADLAASGSPTTAAADADGTESESAGAEVGPTGGPVTDTLATGEGAYRELFENVGDGLVVHDPDTGEIIDVNERFCEMNGYDRAELVGEDIGLVTAPDEEYSYEAAQEMIERARQEGSQLFEWRNQRRDGETFPVEVHLAVVRLDGTERVLACVRDITERRALERTYQQIFRNVGDGLVVHDPDTGEIRKVNDQYCELTGYSHSELEGATLDRIVPDGSEYTVDAALANIERAREEGTQVFEFEGQRKDGDTFLGEVRLSTIELRGREQVLASVRDITERKRREQMVRNLHESTDALQDADTAEAVCEAAVDAAREVLDLSMPVCWLHGVADPETLTPVAATEEAWELPLRDGGPGEFEPGDFEYGLYERGEAKVYDPSDRHDETPLENAVLLPLGDHGLLGAAEPDVDAFDDVTLDAAHILARHARAALDRVERERDLRESERRLRLIADHLDEIIYLSTADFSEILYINPAYEEIYGRPVAELDENPRAFVEAAHPDDRAEYEADVRRLVADVEAGDPDEVYQGQYRIHRDGETRWVSVSRFPIENEDGVVDRIVGRVQDVTERKRREREFEQIFNGVNDAITIHDPETAELLDVNDTFCELLGYDRADVLAMGVEGYSPSGYGYTKAQAREFVREVVESGESKQTEWTVETSDGARRLLEVNGTTATIGGEERFVAIDRDITERRRSERRFRTIAERVEEIIYLANADLTEVKYVNSAYEDIYGRPVAELEEDPRAFIDAVHPDDREGYRADLEAMLADIAAGDPDDRYEFDFRIQRPDGEVRWLEATGYPILDEADEPHQFVGIVEDVTERHRREQTLETFHEATRELTAADSREGACRQAVQAAEEVLGFPLVSAYLYQEETGTLEPAAVTSRLSDLDVDPPAFGPGDSLPWQVFVEGEAVTSSEPTTDVYGPGVSDPDIVLPMGSHGVMLVGAPAESFSDEDVELAQILTATLEAALNHVAGERALAEREAELRRQQERADRLEQLNAIIRDIEQATVEQSSRAGIEEAVCERLVDVDLHDLVWIAEPTAGGDGLVPRTSAGGPEGYVDGLTSIVGSASEPGGGHPAVAAYRTDDRHAVENVATDVTTGEWRKHALGHGVQSVVAVPIRYETTTHGVLTVASADPDAFDEATRDVLTELGRSIGYAITVTEREQALESDGTTELEFAVADEGLFMVRGAAAVGCRIELERTIRRTGGSFSMFYAVDGGDPATVVELADAAPSVATAQVVSTDDEGASGLVEVTAPTWFGSVFTEHGAVVREATAEPGGGTLVVEAPRGTDVRALVEGFQERYPDADLVAQRQRERTIRSLFELQDALQTELTDRQWEALETAYSAGYFDWPRETSGQEVAELLDVSQPTFNKHLRIAERSAFRMLLDREYPESD
ncbi:MAG: PAS domain S-box protein [Haloglomus sp.]